MFKCLLPEEEPEVSDMKSVPNEDSEWISLNMFRDKQLEAENSHIKYYLKDEAPPINYPPYTNILSCSIYRFKSVISYNTAKEKYETKLVPITNNPTRCNEKGNSDKPIEFEIKDGKKIATIREVEGEVLAVKFNTLTQDDEHQLPYGRMIEETWEQVEGPKYCWGDNCAFLTDLDENTFYFAARTNVGEEDRMYKLRFVAKEKVLVDLEWMKYMLELLALMIRR